MYIQKSIASKLMSYGALSLGVLAALLLMFGFAASANAQSPAGCNTSNIQQTPSKSPSGVVYDGDTITYTVTYSNIDPDGDGGVSPCDVTEADAVINFPDGSSLNVLTDVDFPVGTTISCPGDGECAAGPYSYDVDHADEAGGFVTTNFTIDGALQDVTPLPAGDDDNLASLVIHPSTDLSADLDINSVVSGGLVTLTITETNDGDTDLSNVYVEVSPLGLTLDETDTEFTGTDTGGDGILSAGETWEWTVTDNPVSDTTYTVTGHGEDLNGNDITWNEGCELQDPDPNVICDSDEQASDSVRVVEGLTVEKTAETSYDREWDWSIVKSADQTELNLADGEAPVDVNYTVEVDAVSTDVNHVVTGTITITNPGSNPSAEVTSVSDVLDVSGAVSSLDCEDEDSDTSAPWTLSAGEVLSCTYEQDSADPNDSENEVTVTTSGLVPGGSDVEDVIWGDPDDEIDECIYWFTAG